MVGRKGGTFCTAFSYIAFNSIIRILKSFHLVTLTQKYISCYPSSIPNHEYLLPPPCKYYT